MVDGLLSPASCLLLKISICLTPPPSSLIFSSPLTPSPLMEPEIRGGVGIGSLDLNPFFFAYLAYFAVCDSISYLLSPLKNQHVFDAATEFFDFFVASHPISSHVA